MNFAIKWKTLFALETKKIKNKFLKIREHETFT